MSALLKPAPLNGELVRLGVQAKNKDDAIAQVTQLLIAAGCVALGYEESIKRREALADTFLGHGIAIPHGLAEDRHLIQQDGVAVLQFAKPLEWNPGQMTRLVVGIAAQSDIHLNLLRRLTRVIQDEKTLEILYTTTDPTQIIKTLSEESEAPETSQEKADDLAESFSWTILYPNGLHARPATSWSEKARSYIARVQVRCRDQVADGKSLVSLLQLGLRQGDQIVVSAEGQDAPASLAALRQVMESLTAQETADARRAAQRRQTTMPGWQPPQATSPTFVGLGASPGVAIAPIFVLVNQDKQVEDMPQPLEEGGALLHDALAKTRLQLAALHDDTQRRLGSQDAAIFLAHAELLLDTDLITRTCRLMVEGHGVAWSWHRAVEEIADQLGRLDNPVLAGRAADLRDVGKRVLAQLYPSLDASQAASMPNRPCILVATDLSPSETAHLDTELILGLITAQGGPTSHTAIISRTLGLPAVVAAGNAVLRIAHGSEVIIDGGNGSIYLNPTAEERASAQAYIEKRAATREREAAERAIPAHTRDGHLIDVSANINLPEQVAMAIDQGAEGVGLMRTEFLFLERGATPSEEEQYQTYLQMSEALAGRSLIVRALDIGGDKQVAHLALPKEANPFLGVRGARLLLRRPDLLEPQLRALYRAAKDKARLSIMFPMITSVDELSQLRMICERIRLELAAPIVPIGIMIEVPAAAIQADAFAEHADFFSIGTNDLTQYVLAIDRQNPELAPETDSLHPAVLRMIHHTVEGARKHQRWVGVCGGLAGDPFGASLLAGLGVQELSMTPNDIPAIKARLRSHSQAELQALAQRALACATAAAVRALDVDKTDH